jgi:hypothetical protein
MPRYKCDQAALCALRHVEQASHVLIQRQVGVALCMQMMKKQHSHGHMSRPSTTGA